MFRTHQHDVHSLTIPQQFGFGLYDGITGIVTDPYKGAKKEGGVGFVKGVGRGIFSVPFRVMGGAWAVPGYAMKGLYQEMIKSEGSGVQNYIIAARMSQGYDESITVSARERADIVSKWKIVKVNMKKKKTPGDTMDSLHSLVADKRKRKEDRWNRVNSHFKKPEERPSFPPTLSQHNSYSEVATEPASRSNSNALPAWKIQEQERMSRVTTAQSQQSQQSNTELEAQLIAEEEAERRELEAAIAASVAENSHGNAEEDQLMARAIRASVAELERAPPDASSEQNEEEALKRAMQASIEEAGRSGATEEEQKLLEETLRKSLLDTSRRRQHGSDSEWDSSDTEDDADFQRIMAESKELAHLQQHYPQEYQNATGALESGTMGATGGPVDTNAEDDELRRALEESERAEKERQANVSKERSEDEIVMEYIKKQSLLEEEHRQRRLQGRDTGGESSGAGRGASGAS